MTPLNERLSNAEARREEMKKLRKEDMIMEKSNKIKEGLENKLKACEENRDAIIKKTKEDVHAYLSKIEQKVKELEVANEAEKIAKNFHGC